MVSVDKKNRFWIRHKKLMIVGLLVVIVIVVGGLVTWNFLRQKNSQGTGQDEAAAAEAETASRAQQLQNDWEVANAGEDYATSKQQLVQEIEDKKDAPEKAMLYIQLSQLATNSDKNDDALQYAQMAEAADPTNLTARVVADAAVRKGDTATAIKYYKIALERTEAPGEETTDENESKRYFIAEVTDSLKELGQ